MRTSIILPTYNERGNIVELIEAIENIISSEFEYEIVVVDDNSPNGTGELVRKACGNSPYIKTIIRKNERGLATAIKTGILHSFGETIVVMDTDFNHDPKMIPQMIKFLEYYDMIIGSRFVWGGGMSHQFRYYLSYIYSFGIRIVLGLHIKDKLSGFFAIRRKDLLSLDPDKIFYGYGDYFIRMLLRAQKRRFRMLEVPTYYQIRQSGHSKTNFIQIFSQYSWAVLKLIFTKHRL